MATELVAVISLTSAATFAAVITTNSCKQKHAATSMYMSRVMMT
jgi:hypothetical protein